MKRFIELFLWVLAAGLFVQGLFTGFDREEVFQEQIASARELKREEDCLKHPYLCEQLRTGSNHHDHPNPEPLLQDAPHR